jgi:hypothetical protein
MGQFTGSQKHLNPPGKHDPSVGLVKTEVVLDVVVVVKVGVWVVVLVVVSIMSDKSKLVSKVVSAVVSSSVVVEIATPPELVCVTIVFVSTSVLSPPVAVAVGPVVPDPPPPPAPPVVVVASFDDGQPVG